MSVTISYQEFKAWLIKSCTEKKDVGHSNTGTLRDCPIACFLDETQLVPRAQVTRRGIYNDKGSKIADMPEWGNQFMVQIDNVYKYQCASMSANMALLCLPRLSDAALL